MSGPVPKPQGNYRPATRHGALIFTAGMTPRKDGVLQAVGRVGAEDDLAQYREAVRLSVSNALRAAESQLQGDERISTILSMTVYILADASFTRHAALADMASDYLVEVLGPAGIGARAAIGVESLPGGTPVEIQLIAAV